jgi:hypothetical protein
VQVNAVSGGQKLDQVKNLGDVEADQSGADQAVQVALSGRL